MSNGDDRLAFLRTVAQSNVVGTPSRFKKHGYRKPSRRHKSARQLVADESKRIASMLQDEGHGTRRVPRVTFFNVNGPPSTRPTKRYCDVTGLEGRYKSPVNNLRYHNAEIFQLVVKPMAPGVDQEYLKLRGDHFVLK